MTKKIFGDFFFRLINKDVSQYADLESINDAIESKIRKKIHATPYKSRVVHSRGNVFKYSRYNNLNQKIDAYLTK